MTKAEWHTELRQLRLAAELERDRQRWWFRHKVQPALWGCYNGGSPREHDPMFDEQPTYMISTDPSMKN